MLKTQIQELEANKIALTIEVEQEKVKSAYDSFYKRAARSIKVPGFRQGKVPRNIIAKFIGPDAVKEQIEEELIQEVYPQAIRESKLVPISRFELEESKLEENAPFVFKTVFEVKPKLGDFTYTNLSTQIQREIIDDDSVNKVFQQLREQYGTKEKVENAELQNDDYFSAKVEVSCEGEIDEDLSEENASHVLSENDKIFSNCLGMRDGETKEFQITFDKEEDEDSNYYGKTLDYKITIQSISRPKLPELNDEFAAKVGEFESIKVLEEKVTEDLEQRAKSDAEDRAFDDLIDQIIDNYEFDVPEAMVQSTIDFFIEGLDRRYRQYGTSIQNYLRSAGKDVNEFRESFRERAVKQTKQMLIIETIGKKENIEVTDAEYREEIEKRAADYNMPVENLLTTLTESGGEENVRFSLETQKIREFLLKNNQVNYDMVKEDQFSKGETEA